MADNKDPIAETPKDGERASTQWVKKTIKENKLNHQLEVLICMKNFGLSKAEAEIYAWASK